VGIAEMAAQCSTSLVLTVECGVSLFNNALFPSNLGECRRIVSYSLFPWTFFPTFISIAGYQIINDRLNVCMIS